MNWFSMEWFQVRPKVGNFYLRIWGFYELKHPLFNGYLMGNWLMPLPGFHRWDLLCWGQGPERRHCGRTGQAFTRNPQREDLQGTVSQISGRDGRQLLPPGGLQAPALRRHFHGQSRVLSKLSSRFWLSIERCPNRSEPLTKISKSF